MADVHISHLDKHYGEFHALRDINLDIASGEFVVMVGPSGCGKSTLLKSIAGLEDVNSGSISIAGRDVTREEPGDRGIAMVFQSYALYPHMTVRENMGFGLKIAKRPATEINAAVMQAARILRIEEQLDRKPAQLSGGQRQRVAIGRAITRSPDVFLFDEPLSNLDAALRTQMRVELSTLHAELGATMIYVTHDQTEAMTMADRIVVLRAGIIEQVGTPLELYTNPTNQFVASFLGAPRMNFLRATVAQVRGEQVTVTCDGLDPIEVPDLIKGHGLTTGTEVMLGIRPEHLSLSPTTGPTITATVRLTEQLGRESVLYADASPLRTVGSDTGTDNVTVHVGGSHAPRAGTRISIGLDQRHLYLFGPAGSTLTLSKSIDA